MVGICAPEMRRTRVMLSSGSLRAGIEGVADAAVEASKWMR